MGKSPLSIDHNSSSWKQKCFCLLCPNMSLLNLRVCWLVSISTCWIPMFAAWINLFLGYIPIALIKSLKSTLSLEKCPAPMKHWFSVQYPKQGLVQDPIPKPGIAPAKIPRSYETPALHGPRYVASALKQGFSGWDFTAKLWWISTIATMVSAMVPAMIEHISTQKSDKSHR